MLGGYEEATVTGIQGVGTNATVRTDDGRVIPINEVGFGDFEIQALYETAGEFPDSVNANRFLQIYRDSGVEVPEFLQVYLDVYQADMQGRTDATEDDPDSLPELPFDVQDVAPYGTLDFSEKSLENINTIFEQEGLPPLEGLEGEQNDEDVAQSDESDIMESPEEDENDEEDTGDPNGPTTEDTWGNIDLLKKSRCSAKDLFKYLSNINKSYAEAYAKTGKWPSGVQIPKSPNVLNADGSINWAMAPKGGYVLDSNGEAVRSKFTPGDGDIIDRHGPPDGRYVSPIINDMPYSYDERSLPYVEDPSKYHKYKVVGDFTKIEEYVANCTDQKVKSQINAYVTKNYDGDFSRLVTYSGEIAGVDGWGSGGGIQYELPLKVEWLIKLELLEEIR